ncbi:MAG: LAGLIDADG family homing endonuclease [bacterium]|nr:LAGLIDADG family homing endonuclease [bacterium]
MNWSYIAGFIDGEGSVVKYGKYDYRVSIPQTHEGVLQSIQKFVGGGNIFKTRKRKPHWKESWLYCLAQQKAVLHFLKNIYPYVIVKKEIVRITLPKVAHIVARRQRHNEQLQRKIKTCKLLREKGLSYRKIGKQLNLDHGYLRRLILFK